MSTLSSGSIQGAAMADSRMDDHQDPGLHPRPSHLLSVSKDGGVSEAPRLQRVRRQEPAQVLDVDERGEVPSETCDLRAWCVHLWSAHGRRGATGERGPPTHILHPGQRPRTHPERRRERFQEHKQQHLRSRVQGIPFFPFHSAAARFYAHTLDGVGPSWIIVSARIGRRRGTKSVAYIVEVLPAWTERRADCRVCGSIDRRYPRWDVEAPVAAKGER
ncbi:hypothetical protein C8R46DRAFT_1120477 [Mycena filopes]|nr:hypothetical protein C8R46DRAFT_1120477 [Mycena filopes]